MQKDLKTIIKDYLASQSDTILASEISGHIAHIADNLNPQFSIRPYQMEAFRRFITYLKLDHPRPIHLLYQMATGSGKTLIMAGIILELYSRGYRNFIFVVNSTNIIDKTKDNFLNPLSAKYLFNRTIVIDQQKIKIKEVHHFNTSNTDINILFTTVQGLHAKLNTPRENSVTYQDLESNKIVILSDEAHHINADTKKRASSRQLEEEHESWENTMGRIHVLNSKNILVEFTATMELTHTSIAKKYEDKLIFDYALRSFRNDGFSKEVEVLQSSGTAFERTLAAIILSHYRQRVFEDHGVIAKPVILLKSKTIKESQSFYEQYIEYISYLTELQIEALGTLSQGNVLRQAFDYFDQKGITNAQLVTELKLSFGQEVGMIVNSKNDSEDKQILLNTLEDENNPYRLIFTVDKLNEGWDVLNLFDIVRLYDTKSSDHKLGRIAPSTMSEAQLIGRGARYFPFQTNQNQPLYQRKYDDDLTHPLRICEQMYYHATYNPSYIRELGEALIEIGLKEHPSVNATIKKPKFKDHLQTIDSKMIDPKEVFKAIKLSDIFHNMLESNLMNTPSEPISQHHEVREIRWSAFHTSVIKKAIRLNRFYTFDNLQKLFPTLMSIDQFINDSNFLNSVSISISYDKKEDLTALMTPEKQLKISSKALIVIQNRILNR